MIRWSRRFGTARASEGSGADSSSVHRDTTRLVAFSDAVFAISITLLVLEIKPPAEDSHLLHGLLAYAVTFLFIGQVWANHHVMFDHIVGADRVVLLLNTLLLMVVARSFRSPPPSLPGRCAADRAGKPRSSSTASRLP